MNDRKSYEDEHTESHSSPPLSSRAASGLPNSMHPEAIHLGHQVPAQLVEVPCDASPSMASLHPDVKSLRRVPVASPPVHGEVPSLVTKQMLEGEAVSKEEETRADTCSPMPSAALSLPERTPILSMRAISSRQGGNKSQPPRSTLAAPRRHGSTNVVNQGTAATVHRPGVSLPFQSGHRSSAPKIPPDQVEVLSSTKRSISDTVVSSEQTSTAMCSPLSPAIHLLPKLPPAIAAQDVSKMVSKTVQQPIKKAVVSKRVTNTAPRLPLLPTIPVPPTRSVPVSSTCNISSRKAGKEPELPVPVATKRHIVETSVVNTRSTVDAETHHAAVDVGSSAKRPANVDECAPKRSTDAQQLARLQVRPSKLPGGTGEERHTAYVVRKINEEKTTSCLPESAADLTSTIPPSPQTPPIPSLEPLVVLTPLIPTTTEQRANDVVSRNKKTSVHKRLPEAAIAPTLPVHSPAAPMQAATLRQPLDEGLPPIEVAPKRRDLCVVNTKPLSSDTHLLKVETARKQSESVKNPSFEGEGKYLERAAAYVRERIGRRTLACDSFVPQAQKEPPDKMVDSEMHGRHGQEVVTNPECSNERPFYHGRHMLPVPTDLPSVSVPPASPTNAGQQNLDIVNKEDKTSVTHSPEIEHEGLLTPCSTRAVNPAPSASGSPASPNNDLISRKDQSTVGTYSNDSYDVGDEALRHTSDAIDEGHETNAKHLLEVEDELLAEAAGIQKHLDECSSKNKELAQ